MKRNDNAMCKALNLVHWLGIELIDNDLEEADLTIKDIKKYIKDKREE